MKVIKMAEKSVKIIPRKNYIIFFVFFMLTVLGLIYIIQSYKEYKEVSENEPIIMNYINKELNYEELDEYLIDNDQAIIYLGISNDELSRNFEKEFGNEIERRELQDKIIYINLSDMKKNNANYLNLINTRHNQGNEIELKKIPAILIFKDRMLVDMIYADSDGLNIGYVINLLIKHEMMD